MKIQIPTVHFLKKYLNATSQELTYIKKLEYVCRFFNVYKLLYIFCEIKKNKTS